jgi:hypothetical protein
MIKGCCKNSFYKNSMLHRSETCTSGRRMSTSALIQQEISRCVLCSAFCVPHRSKRYSASCHTLLALYSDSLMSVSHGLFQIIWCWQWQKFIHDIVLFLYDVYSLYTTHHPTTSTCNMFRHSAFCILWKMAWLHALCKLHEPGSFCVNIHWHEKITHHTIPPTWFIKISIRCAVSLKTPS